VREPIPDPVQAGDWLTARRFAALLAVLVCATWPQVLLGWQTFIYRDFGYYAYPLAHQLRESFWHGEIPLWSHLSYCGSPFLAQWNTQVLYPPALFYLVLPLAWALPVFCLGHLYLGGLGMFLLARRWTGGSLSAATAGVAYAFSGLMVNSLMWPGTIPGLAWMPWLVWLAERAWREGGRLTLAAALVGALQMLSGAAEPVMLTWVLLGTLWLGEFAGGETPRGKLILRGGGIALLVAALSAAQLLPFLDLLSHSDRQETFDSALWPMPTSGWANFLAPLFHTRVSFHGVFMQPAQSWTYSYYVGVLAAVMAAGAVGRGRGWRVGALAGLTLLCLLLALGDATPLYRWAREHVFIVKTMRFPVKFVILPVFALPLLAAFTLARREDFARRKKAWSALGFAALAAMLVLAWLSYALRQPKDPWQDVVKNTALHALLFTAILALWLYAETAAGRRQVVLQLAVLTLIWLDVSHHAPQPQTVNPVVYQPGLPRDPAPPQPGEGRALMSHEAGAQLLHSYIADIDRDYLSRRFALFSNCNLLDGIPKVDGFFPMQLRIAHEIQLLFYNLDAPDPAPAPLLDFLGVTEMSTPGNVFEWTSRPGHLPLVTGGQAPVFTSDSNTVQVLASDRFQPRTEVFISAEKGFTPSVTNAAAVQISNIRFAAQRVTAHVDAAAPGWVVVAQSYYHPWRAYVDGQPVHLWRANYAFQAVEVPAGAHALKLAYEDRRFLAGAGISFAALLACGGGFWLCGRRKSPPLTSSAPTS
jgi:Bacterial membrane protein YfhO